MSEVCEARIELEGFEKLIDLLASPASLDRL
jgi:hypothetical protein